MLASVIVNNHDYGRVLGRAIESALAQTHRETEVIVVDDGSTDESREVLGRYSDGVLSVLKPKGGQTSALNAGFEVSRGELVCFLDADDELLPTALERALERFGDGVSKVHWPLEVVDAEQRPVRDPRAQRTLDEGDLAAAVRARGPESYTTVPTSGNAWSRKLLELVFPLAELEPALGVGSAYADGYLSDVAPLVGEVRAVPEPQGLYRIHGANDYAALDHEEKWRRDRWFYDDRCDRLAAFCRARGLAADPARWRRESWLHRFLDVREQLRHASRPDETLVLVDEDELVLDELRLRDQVVLGRRAFPFLERDGEYWGRPADDAAAVSELERLRARGATLVAVAWPAVWWLGHYAGFRRHLDTHARRVVDNDLLVAFRFDG
jgi:glycosyltransferase involved in cell wall biosynthesis